MKEDCYSRRRWRQIQYMADLFWSRWTKEYLPQLQERQKWQKLKRNLVPGDIVLIVDNSAPRNSWIMGRILKDYTRCFWYCSTCLCSDKNLSVGKTNNKTLLIARSRRRVRVYIKTVNINFTEIVDFPKGLFKGKGIILWLRSSI